MGVASGLKGLFLLKSSFVLPSLFLRSWFVIPCFDKPTVYMDM